MKKLILFSVLSALILTSCAGNSADNEEKQDSIAAEQAADSMLRDAATDTLEADGTLTDTSGTDSLELQKK